MTPVEFKAWFDGFTEMLSGVPTKTQWARIKDRVAEIDGRPITERYYIDHYWPRYSYPIFYPGIVSGPTYWSSGDVNNVGGVGGVGGVAAGFNSCNAMFTVGKSDAQALLT